jgi:hypothetical protein
MDPRFSPEEIGAAPDRDERIAELQREVVRLIRPDMDAAMRRVASELNALGHHLVEEALNEQGCICFETEKEAAGLYFYLCLDTTISAGWRS